MEPAYCTVYVMSHDVRYTIYYTLYSVQCTLYIVQLVHTWLYSVQCTLYIVQCTVYSVHCTMYSLRYVTWCKIHYILYIVLCTMYTIHYEIHYDIKWWPYTMIRIVFEQSLLLIYLFSYSISTTKYSLSIDMSPFVM